ncbi:MAG: aldo/keto reductase [Chloroflexi bacterium]|nr:aldo/keto reductase [Chloroflexota bacterium]
MTLSIDSTVQLNNGVAMPRFGLGTYQTPAGSSTENAVRHALEVGYRAVDTAALYGNESGVGNAVRAGIVPREQVFVTSKVWVDDLNYEDTKAAFDATMQQMGLDTLDLYLIHWPVNDWQGAWRALEEIHQAGRVRAIGVSNFLQHHLETLFDFAEIRPTVNQVELHPFLQQPDLVAFCHEYDIQVTAWAPLMKGRVMDVPELVDIGQQFGKTAIQVTLRWMLQIGLLTIPKSAKPEHIDANADIFDFELSDSEIQTINSLDRDERLGMHPDHFGE